MGEGPEIAGAAPSQVPPSERRWFNHGAAWTSAIAAALSAVVAAAALVFGSGSGDTAEPVTAGPSAPDATPGAAAERTIAIGSMSFVGDDPAGPAFEFRGTAELEHPEDEEIRVIARPRVEDGGKDDWLISPAAKVARNGSWLTTIKKPPLPDGSFLFAAVIAPAASKSGALEAGGSVFAKSANVDPPTSGCRAERTLKRAGVKSCGVLDATVVQTYDP